MDGICKKGRSVKMRRAILLMTDQFVMNFLKATLTTDREMMAIVKHGLPDDVKIVRFGYDGVGTLRLMLESEEFDDIEDGKEYPELPYPVFKRGII